MSDTPDLEFVALQEALLGRYSLERESLRAEVRAARDAAEKRLSEAVAALETIRLELLRLHAGAGSVESMTADLTSALELSEDIERVLEGGREVEKLLGSDCGTESGGRS